VPPCRNARCSCARRSSALGRATGRYWRAVAGWSS
jgi:hypothetical protein